MDSYVEWPIIRLSTKSLDPQPASLVWIAGQGVRYDPETVVNGLLAVSFLPRSPTLPGGARLENQQKIDTILFGGCSVSAIPHRGGKPICGRTFVLWYEENQIAATA